jgi:2-polyprenyl-6-methoxyphenol hydroxylase-like FAD-dependent oxidoreductase
VNDRTPKRPPTAIVVGGSLAGLMTSLTLSRVGVKVTLLERSGPDRTRGGGLLVSDGLVERVTGWGLAPGTRPVPTTLTGGMHSWHTIFTALYSAVEHDPGVTVVHNARVTAADQDDNAAWATTDDARVFSGDVVIGADGHRSVVRAAVDPEHPDATFAGYLVWLATMEEENLPAALSGNRSFDQNVFLGDDNAMLLGGSFPGEGGGTERGHRTIGWAVYDSTHNDLLYRNGNVRDSVVHHSVSADEIPDDLDQHLARIGRGRWPNKWTELMHAALRAGRVIGTPISEYVPAKVVNGRLAIVGDAAHVATPMTGAGFTEALDDAEALADAIATAARHEFNARAATAALLRYEKTRLRSARSSVQFGQNFSKRFRPAA